MWFPPRLSRFQLRVLLLPRRVAGAPGQGPPALVQWAPLVDVSVVSIFDGVKKGLCAWFI